MLQASNPYPWIYRVGWKHILEYAAGWALARRGRGGYSNTVPVGTTGGNHMKSHHFTMKSCHFHQFCLLGRAFTRVGCVSAKNPPLNIQLAHFIYPWIYSTWHFHTLEYTEIGKNTPLRVAQSYQLEHGEYPPIGVFHRSIIHVFDPRLAVE